MSKGSFRRLNGDLISGLVSRCVYFLQCVYLWNINPFRKPDIQILNFKPNLRIKHDSFKGSPSRIACDIFWASISYENLSNELNDKLHILDVGAGNCRYKTLLNSCAPHLIGSYTGLDLFPRSDTPRDVNFILDDALNASKYLNERVNFVISQSALEHISRDVEVLIRITQALMNTKRNFCQIHVIPSPLCLLLYLWHGWRQYSISNLSEIRQAILELTPDVNVEVIKIGGLRTFFLHLVTRTLPKIYQKMIRTICRISKKHNVPSKDIDLPVLASRLASADQRFFGNLPVFYALVIRHPEINLSFNENIT